MLSNKGECLQYKNHSFPDSVIIKPSVFKENKCWSKEYFAGRHAEHLNSTNGTAVNAQGCWAINKESVWHR